MSRQLLSHRALVALAAMSLATTLACASGGSKEPESSRPENSTDTSSFSSDEGKSMEDLFAGRFAGVTVSRAAGGGLQIRIRGGSNSFYGGDEPLYVVDETPIQPGPGGIVFLNPSDIEKIEVLKNPADIGIYGVRGGNGVIKITMKKPGRS